MAARPDCGHPAGLDGDVEWCLICWSEAMSQTWLHVARNAHFCPSLFLGEAYGHPLMHGLRRQHIKAMR